MSTSQPPAAAGASTNSPTTATNSPAPSIANTADNTTESNQPQKETSPANMVNNGGSAAGRGGGSVRGKRTKRDSRKKREAKGDLDNGPEKKKVVTGPVGAGAVSSAIPSSKLSMLRPVMLTDPRPIDVLHPKPRQMNLTYEKRSDVLKRKWDFYEIVDKLSNRGGYRYSYAAEDPGFPHIKYRQTDVPPYHSRFSFEDSPTAIAFTQDGLAVTTGEPWHSARANICAREGTYYYEARVISGIVQDNTNTQPLKNGNGGGSPRGNVRMGFMRREAELDVNVGLDCYGYGIRDVNGEVVNRMRCEYFFPKGEAINEGDVIGFMITLPPLAVHKKIVEGTYDPSIDHVDDYYDKDNPNGGDKAAPASINIIRDRIPFHLKSDFLYQQNNIFATKQLRDYAFNLKDPTATSSSPSPLNAEDPSLRTLPGSKITIYKNGVEMGTPFEGLFAFLPPASRGTNSNNLGIGKRENADDGMIGYFPAVSCHNGGAVECRFEAPWWYGPPKDTNARPFGDRYNDQIAEDVVADIVDEVEAAFMGWNTDGGKGLGPGGPQTAAPTAATGTAGTAYFGGDGAGGGYASVSANTAQGTMDMGFDDGLSRSSTHTPHYQPAPGTVSVAGSTLDSATFASEKELEDVEMS
ncbi:hypothetical protein FQN54_002771 [Arachnomyces sp. PD_36]|nr:hypothetical protein FQN54_002771 [Arachnomyces sp. PD_36]